MTRIGFVSSLLLYRFVTFGKPIYGYIPGSPATSRGHGTSILIWVSSGLALRGDGPLARSESVEQTRNVMYTLLKMLPNCA